MEKLQGIPASSGIALGKVFLVEHTDIVPIRVAIAESDIQKEQTRFEEAKQLVLESFQALRKRIGQDKSLLAFVESQELMVADPMLSEAVEKYLAQELVNLERAVELAVEEIAALFEQIDDELLKERAIDVRDVGKRIIHILSGIETHTFQEIHEQVVLVTHNLMPSDLLMLDKKYIQGIAIDQGGKTSHTSILARAFGIPTVLGLEHVTQVAHHGDTIIVDGLEGVVVVEPDTNTTKLYQSRIDALKKQYDHLKEFRKLSATTTDGTSVQLKANIEIPEETTMAQECGASGIGLYRTEFLYLQKNGIPTEDEQTEAYTRVVKAMKDTGSVTFRTIDVGGDKILAKLDYWGEENPVLGWRAVRFCLDNKEIFITQLRAILRASAHGAAKIMFPMVSGVDEFEEALAVVHIAMDQLAKEKIPFDEKIPVGTMIEVPSAVMVAPALAGRADFFSIGTNDLIQYTLAVDRNNEKIANLYQPYHPSVLASIKRVVDSGKKHGIPVAVCGEMASDPVSALFLMGLGVSELSMSAVVIPQVKEHIRNADFGAMQKMVNHILSLERLSDILGCIDQWSKQVFGDTCETK